MRNQFHNSNDSQSIDVIIQDEFMSNSQSMSQSNFQSNNPDEMQKMFSIFQKMAADPNMFMKMFSSVQGGQPSQETEHRKREFQVEQHKYRNHEISPRRKDNESPISDKDSRKKGKETFGHSNLEEKDNVLERYTNNEPIKKTTNRFNEDRPIKTSYDQPHQQEESISQSRFYEQQPFRDHYDDDRPINPAKGYTYDLESNQSQVIVNNSVPDPFKYQEAEERPIKGIEGDFKAHIMKEQGFPFGEEYQETIKNDEYEEEDEDGKAPKTRTFLKRGSRQFLSSAKDKSVNKVKPKIQTKEALETSKSNIRESEKPERSVSQNRVLGRKSVSSKSITKKIPTIPKEEEQKIQHSSNISRNYNNSTAVERNKTPKRDPQHKIVNREESLSPSFHLDNSISKKKNKKNIFQDSSSEEEVEQEVGPMSRGANKKQNQEEKNFANKSEVIPGVFLTKKELHSILTKYGKNQVENSNETNTVQELKARYVEYCNVLAEEKERFTRDMQKEKEEFESFKQSEIAKIKNERKVQERNNLNSQKSKEREKEKEDFESLRKVLEKEREEFKHKEKNMKIMIEKYKKLADEREKSNYDQRLNNNEINKSEDSTSIANKRKKTTIPPETTYSEPNDEVVVSSKIDRSVSSTVYHKDPYEHRNRNFENSEKLPDYSELKKSNFNAKNTNFNQSQLVKSPKYDYEELENKETVTRQKYFREPSEEEENDEYHDNNSENENDREEIVEYNPSMKLSDLLKIPLNIKMVTNEMINNLFRSQNNEEYKKYLEIIRKPRNKVHSTRNANEKKTTNIYADGGREMIFDNGVKKEYFPNNYSIIFFANGDIKQKLPDETVLYFYKQKEVDQITLPTSPEKIEIFRFENNQVEFHFGENNVQIRHADGTLKMM